MANETTNKVPNSIMKVAWILVLGALAPLLDSTMVNIAINNLVKSLNSSVATVQWTVTGYVLATGIAVPFSSWLLNKFDGKSVFLAGEILFGIGSILSALAPNIQFLIAARLVQGFAGGLIMPLLTTLLVQTAGAARMGQMMATVGLPMVLGPLLGPILGGVIIKYLSWHWIFWVNVPVMIISVGMIIWGMPKYPAQNKKAKMDFIGIMLLAGATSSIIYGIVKASRAANFSNRTTLVFVISGLVVLGLYVIWAKIRQGQAVLPLLVQSFLKLRG